ncbi:non-ribosomal peptide synthase/polyketide synthase [Pseudomonas sp. NPDC008258]|uniref:non-ribosomal peptide synthase/polyketide synthase n=1 Tax=Pseudomonas sp. NPDC008258 TaxID=3364418 RepID=UPI0036ED6266
MQELLESVKLLSTKERQALAALLKQQGVNLYGVTPIFKREPGGAVPLSYAQQRQWFLWQLDPAAPTYNIPAALRLQGCLDVEALQRSFDALIARHETLRTTFSEQGQDTVQVIHPKYPLMLQAQALQGADEHAVLEQVEAEARRPFDLQQGPLLRVKLLRLAQDEHVLVVTMHHIVSDGWSMPLMIDELMQLYAGYSQGEDVQLPALPVQYADYAIWQRQWMEAGEQERQLAYWKAQLGDDQPVLELPTDRPRAATNSHRGARHEVRLPEALVHSLKQLAQRQGATLFMLLLASFQTLLHRYSGQSDIRVGVPVANRNRVETERLIGFFVNTQVLRAEFDLQMTFSQLLEQVKQRVLGAQSHQDLPFEQLVDALQPERSLSHSPLFQVLYNHQMQAKGKQRSVQGLQVAGLSWDHDTAKFDLTLDTFEYEHSLGAALSYATDLFDAATIEQMAQHWVSLLEAIVRQPGQRVAELPLIGQQVQQQIVQAWNPALTHCPVEQTLHQLIEAQVEAAPDAVALVFGEQTLSYAELNCRANPLAHRLIELGAGPDVLVGLAVERGLEMVIGLLAILKAGAAYVPLDPEYPQDRLGYMFEDSGIRLLLTQQHLRNGLPVPAGVHTLMLDDEAGLAGYSEANPACQVGPDNLAYVIYTSGSTGKPKGTLLPHRNVVRLFAATRHWFHFDASDVWTVFHSYAFDFSVWELYGALLYGGKAVIVPKDVARSSEDFHALLVREQVTVLNQTPSAFKPLIPVACEAAGAGRQLALRYVVFGGEALEVSSLKPWFEAFGDRQPRMINMYGITETTVHVTYRPITLDDLRSGASSPIGEVIPDLSWYLLDAALNPILPGCTGEMLIGQAGLARGYHGRPGLTAERFVPNPFDDNGGRLYRSGDLARYRSDGVIEYIGRIDHQVKIRGFRIELGEIEARLLEQPAVRQVAVLAVDGDSGKQLVGYVVPADTGVLQGAEQQARLRDNLRGELKASLPEHMVPAHLLFLEQLPLTGNGKLDRKALPAPDASLLQGEYVAPQSELEQQIAAIWADVLKLEKVGLADNFFELGGDSIMSLQVVSRARQLDIQFTPKELFQHQTVQGLAAVARRESGTAIDQGRVEGSMPLTPIQQWFFESDIVARHHWNQSVLLSGNERLDEGHLRAALQCVIEHHDALRLRFNQVEGAWQAVFVASQQEVLWRHTVAHVEALEQVAEQAQRSLNLEHGPLLRAVLGDLADGTQRLQLVIHHLVVDGVSWRVLLEDLQQAYHALAAGRTPQLPAKTSAFKVWAEQLQNYATGSALQQELAYWQAQLGGVDDALPCDNPQGANLERHATSVATCLDEQWTHKLLHDAPAAYRTQINDLLLTALARVIGRWTGEAQVLVRLEGHGREDLFDGIDLTRTVGWFTSMFPVKLSPQAQWADSIKTIKEQLRAVPNKGIGYGVLRYLGDEEARQVLAQLPAGEVVFNYLGQFDSSFDTATGLLVPAQESTGQGHDDATPLSTQLAINGQVFAGELKLNWSFSRERYKPSTVQRLADAFAQELKALIEHCCQAQSHGVTPSDFPLAGLTQTQLDNLPVAAAQIADVYPLSPMQQGMLFHSLYEEGSGNYINQMRVDVDNLDTQRFKQAWLDVLAAHDIMRTGFVWIDELEQAVQVVHKTVEPAFSEHDWSAEPFVDQSLQALAEAERHRGFELADAPLVRLVLVRSGANRHHLIYTNHHILMDGWSTSRLLGEVLQRYGGQQMASQGAHYRDYIAWLKRQDSAAAEVFWRGQLAALEEPTRLASSIAHRGNEGDSVSGHAEQYQLFDLEQTRRIEAFARANRVTVNTLVQSAWLLLLQRVTGQATVCFGATVAGRPADLPGVEEQIGLFINTLPVVGAPRSEQSVAQWLEQVQSCNLALREFEHTPLFEVQRWAGLGGEALFDSLLVFENYPVSQALKQAAPGGLNFGEVINREQTNYPLTLAVVMGNKLSIKYGYDLGCWSDEHVNSIAGYLQNLLLAMIQNADSAVGDLQLLGSSQMHVTLNDWGRSATDYPAGQTVIQQIEAQVALTPQATAVIFAEQTLSYDELNQRANQLALHLRERGVGPETLVGIAMERSAELVIGLLAILKVGGAYVPLDPEYPQDRLAYMLDDSGVTLLLVNHQMAHGFTVPDHVQCLPVDLLAAAQQAPVPNLPCQVSPQNLAYVMYTSGSTGKPKGAGIHHQALSGRLRWMQDTYALDQDDVILQKTSFSFDVSVWELLWPLTCGAKVLLARQGDQRDPYLLIDLIRQHAVTTLHFIPSMLRGFIEAEGVGECQSLKRLFSGGEALPPELLNQALQCLPHVAIHNRYGPVEATINATHSGRLSQRQGDVEIGRVLPDTRIHILDTGLGPVPQGVCGELYIGGAALARGYFRKAQLTAERFIPDPFDPVGGQRLYRTGDLARFRPDGVVEYAGRIDHQVKVRGFRIELGEIEAGLQAQDAVRTALVITQPGVSGNQLVAYLIPVEEQVLDSAASQAVLREQIRSDLKNQLPDYMIPAHMLFLAGFPLTPNGKLDRRALPQPDANVLQGEYIEPKTELERQIAAIWASVLKLDQVGLLDNFFELGGDSIISLQVVSRARQAGIHFSPKALFEQQTVQGVAAVAESKHHNAQEQEPLAGSLVLTPAQWAILGSVARAPEAVSLARLAPAQALDTGYLNAALHALHERHDVLRLRFEVVEGEWRAAFGDVPTALLHTREVTDSSALEQLAEELKCDIDPARGILMRAALGRLPDGSQHLLIAGHPVAIDDNSWHILLQDLQSLYDCLANGAPLLQPGQGASFKAWAQHLQADGARAQGHRDEWQAQLPGTCKVLPRRAMGDARASLSQRIRMKLDRHWTGMLLDQALASSHTRMSEVLLITLARVIGSLTDQADIVLSRQGSLREGAVCNLDVSRAAGCFSIFQPVKVSPHGELQSAFKVIKEQLRSVPDDAVLHVHEDGECSTALERLLQGNVLFNHRDWPKSFDQEYGVFGKVSLNFARPTHDLVVDSEVADGQLLLNWTFNSSAYEPSLVQQLAEQYVDVLKAIVSHCCDSAHLAVVPSDFPLAKLSQSQLDSLPVDVAQVAEIYPLSPMQQGMLFYTLQGAEAGLYINQTAVSVEGLDIERFAEAWRQVIARHDILRTGFWSAAQLKEPLQVVSRRATLPLRVLDWRAHEVNRQALKALAEEDAMKGFDLGCAPLMRMTLVRLANGQLHLIWTRHHILMDGWSDSRLLGEVLQTYHGDAVDSPVAQFGGYIRWLTEQPQDTLEHFWSAKLRSLETPTLLADAITPRPQGNEEGHAALYLRWDSQQTGRLREQAQRMRITPNTLIQGAWLLLLQRYTGQPTVCFGATVAGRPAGLQGADEMLGLFINTLPVVQAPTATQRVSEWLHQLQSCNLELRDHEHAALANVQRWAGRPGQPLFDSIVVFENFPVDERLQQGNDATLQFGDVSARGVTNYAMDLAVELGATLQVEFMYLRSRFTETATETLRGSFESLLAAMLENPDAMLGSLNMLTTAEAEHVRLRNRLEASAICEPLLCEQITRHAVERPDAMAVICGERQLTYGVLNERANQLAHHLISSGVRPESCVGIALERSVDVIVAFLAVMKTGAAYVPLDVDYPQERLQWIVEDAAMHLLITSSGLRQRFAQVECCVELDRACFEHLPAAAPAVQMSRDNLAYLIYTSGSTGKPKGVAVSHEQIRMHCQAIAGLYEMDQTTRELLFMSFAFDGAQERWLTTLSVGGCLVVRDNRLWTAEETWHTLHRQRIDVACFPPAYLQQLAEFAESQQQPAPAVRVYCFGGDAVPDALFEQVKRVLRPQWLTNGYGPTETVVTPLLWKVPGHEACEAVYAPIGDRVGSRTLHVLDHDLNPLPDGVAGELYIGGHGVARGYHQRAALTAERFVADPFGRGGRLYRTGDRVRRRANGIIDFIGRLDNQLKIRGFRIEPGEIEARLRNLPGVRDAVVVAREVATGKQLIGYVVTGGADASAQQLRDALRGDLPDYMVPAQLVLLPTLPLTPNGKIDRQALPAPEFVGQREHVAARNAVEQALVEIWQEVLEVERVSVEDNFFELGGDSLRVLKMLSNVRARQLPVELKLRDVITRPTIGELSGYAANEASLDPLLLLNSRVAHTTPLFCLHAGFGTVFDYEPLARRLEGRCTVYGLQCRMLLDQNWVDDSIQSMAIDYAQYIRQKQPCGPYHLVGWSLGGTLAILVARELENQGQQVALLGLIDSFIPVDEPAVPAPDWSDDLHAFLGVMLGTPAQQHALPSVAADTDRAALEVLIDDMRLAYPSQSVYSGISSGELAQTFVVAMRLKLLSQQMVSLPDTRVAASCWWAGDRGDRVRVAGSMLHVAVDAGHFDIPKHADVLDGVVAGVMLKDTVND